MVIDADGPELWEVEDFAERARAARPEARESGACGGLQETGQRARRRALADATGESSGAAVRGVTALVGLRDARDAGGGTQSAPPRACATYGCTAPACTTADSGLCWECICALMDTIPQAVPATAVLRALTRGRWADLRFSSMSTPLCAFSQFPLAETNEIKPP